MYPQRGFKALQGVKTLQVAVSFSIRKFKEYVKVLIATKEVVEEKERTMTRTQVNIRLDDECLKRVDEVAKLMGKTRSSYCAYIVETLHGKDFNPLTVAQEMLESNAVAK